MRLRVNSPVIGSYPCYARGVSPSFCLCSTNRCTHAIHANTPFVARVSACNQVNVSTCLSTVLDFSSISWPWRQFASIERLDTLAETSRFANEHDTYRERRTDFDRFIILHFYEEAEEFKQVARFTISSVHNRRELSKEGYYRIPCSLTWEHLGSINDSKKSVDPLAGLLSFPP